MNISDNIYISEQKRETVNVKDTTHMKIMIITESC